MKYIRAVQAVLNATKGCIGRGTSFFYRAFGNNEEEYMNILLMPDTMILYRFFFEWLESKNHPLSTYKWLAIIDSLSSEQRQHLICYLDENKTNTDGEPEYIVRLLPFYKNLRDAIEEPTGFLYHLKKEFDQLNKAERDNILETVKGEYCKQNHKAYCIPIVG
ncbi:MAG: hypothetical protein IJ200_04560 [Prevotella sp.]|nr:hypothetical protein [Prevotella sp.]